MTSTDTIETALASEVPPLVEDPPSPPDLAASAADLPVSDSAVITPELADVPTDDSPQPTASGKRRGGKRAGAGRKKGAAPKVSASDRSHGDGVESIAPPFAGGPPDMGTPSSAESTSGRGEVKAPKPQIRLEPTMLAAMLVAGIDGAAKAMGEWRYAQLGGEDPALRKANAERLCLTPEERDQVKDAALEMLRAASVTVTPPQAFVLAVGMAIVPKVIGAEMELRSAKKQGLLPQ